MKRLMFLAVFTVMALLTNTALARVIHGTVLDGNDREPVMGASVVPAGSSKGVTTDAEGKFALELGNAKNITVSFIGMKPQTVPAVDNMTVVLESAQSNLDEVVVVAYGTQKKSSITGAVSQIGSKDIEQRPVSSVAAALEGRTSGISVQGNYGSPGSSPTILVRGYGTVNGGSVEPLIVLDGVPFGGNITDINPEDVESMSVLKDAASAALYGNRASNGVLLITTKKSSARRPTFTFKTNQGWYERGTPEYDRVDARDFMNIEYQNAYNKFFSQNASKDRYNAADAAEAHNYVSGRLVDDRMAINVWNADQTNLFGTDGRLRADVAMLPDYVDDLDWFKQGTRTGYRGEYLFSGAGASDKSDYYFSVGYLDENGFMKDSKFERFTGRAVVNIQPRKWFKTGLNLSGSHQKYNNTAAGMGDNSTTTTNPYYFARFIAPIYAVHLHNPRTGEYMRDEKGNLQYDPGYVVLPDDNGNPAEYNTRMQLQNNHSIWEAELNKSRSVRNTVNSIAYADIILPYGFTFTLKGNLNVRNTEENDYGNKVIGGSAKGGAESGSMEKVIYNYKDWTFQQQLRWDKTYGKHTVRALVGHENYSKSYDYTYGYKKGENQLGLAALVNFNVLSSLNGYRQRYRTESYLARVQYNYDDRYNVEASFRRDGSSRFHKDARWGNFGSVGANWVFTNEAFAKEMPWITNGKVRVNWGQVGNDGGSSYYAYYSLYNSDLKGGQAAYYMSQFPSKDLHWETGESWGVAVEGRLFNRWNLAVEYYDRKNKDLLFDIDMPLSVGGVSTDSYDTSITRNFGTITNRGIEINTDVDIYRDKNWTVNLAANLTTLSNKIEKLPEQYKDGIVSGNYRIAEGHSRFDYYLYHWAGVDMMDGNSLYSADLEKYHVVGADGNIIGGTRNAEGDLTSTELKAADYKLINGEYYVSNTTYAGKRYCGYALPKVYGSFTPSFGYRDFNLSMLFTYATGGKVIDSSYTGLMSAGSKVQAYHQDILNAWNGRPEGMTDESADRINPNICPQINDGISYNNTTSDRWLTSRNFWALKNINFTYRLPRNLVNKLDLSGITCSFSAENVYTHTARKGMQAMQAIGGGMGNYLPSARVYTFGVQVNL